VKILIPVFYLCCSKQTEEHRISISDRLLSTWHFQIPVRLRWSSRAGRTPRHGFRSQCQFSSPYRDHESTRNFPFPSHLLVSIPHDLPSKSRTVPVYSGGNKKALQGHVEYRRLFDPQIAFETNCQVARSPV